MVERELEVPCPYHVVCDTCNFDVWRFTEHGALLCVDMHENMHIDHIATVTYDDGIEEAKKQ